MRCRAQTRWGVLLGMVAFACGGQTSGVMPVPGAQPVQHEASAGSDAGHASGGGSSSSSGAHGGSLSVGGGGAGGGGSAGLPNAPTACGSFPAAWINAPLATPVSGTPDGVFTACRNTVCVSDLTAGVESKAFPHVRVDVLAKYLQVTWSDSNYSSGPDVYTLTFSPTGSGMSFELFSTSVSYGVLPLAPDNPGPGCPTVVYQAQVQLTQAVDLYGGSVLNLDAGTDAGTDADSGAH